MATNLSAMNKDQLLAEAARLEVEGIDEAATKADIVAAIEASDAYKAEAEAGAEAAVEEGPKAGRFLVNGVLVDFNGKPVED